MSAVADTDYARSLLVTDLYQLNMVEAYLAEDMTGTAVFELFSRALPPSRGFLMAAGLAQAVTFLTEARISPAELAWLRETGRFSERTLAFLADFRFSGDVDAPPEGTVVFPDEPLIRVTAPIAEAQLVETRLINFLHFQTLVATKAARMRLAAPEAGLVDFGLRRAHAGESGVLAARAACLAGFDGTASVEAGRLFGLPLMGTMAHSYIQAHEDEVAAFRGFARARPDQTVFLLDTYDTERAAARVGALARELAAEGITTRGVRLDSGDLAAHARTVRAILDREGLEAARIVASGGLDEHDLAVLTAEGAPIDDYGVGTSLVTSEDLPALDIAYKLKAYDGAPRRKLSEGKSYWAGPVQAWRATLPDGRFSDDLLTPAADEAPAAEGMTPLLAPVLRGGAPVSPAPGWDAMRAHARAQLAALPEPVRRLEGAATYPVRVSPELEALAEEADRRAMG